MTDLIADVFYFSNELQNPDYLYLLRHEFIHIKLHYLCRKNINPVITSKRFIRNNKEWFKCVCDLRFNYDVITIIILLRILISTIMSMLYDIIFYIINGTYFLIRVTITEHFLTFLSYLFKLCDNEG